MIHFNSDSKIDARTILARQAELEELRKPFHSIWNDIAEKVAPAWLGFDSEDVPIKTLLTYEPTILDSTARRGSQVWACGLLTGTCCPYQRWQRQLFERMELNEIQEAKEWIQALEDMYYDILFRAGYYKAQYHGFLMHGLFGWHTLLIEESDVAKPLVIRSLPLNEVYLDQDNNGTIDTHSRKFKYTSRQAVMKWGYDKLPSFVKSAYDRHDFISKFTFLQMVFPAEDRNDIRLDRNNLPIASITVSCDAEEVIKESGYYNSPFITSRAYHIPSTPYGYSPGTEALADINMINEMKRLIIEAGQLAVAPPLLAPHDGFVSPPSFDPYSINYYRADGNFNANNFTPLKVGNDPRFAWELFQSVKEDINSAFMVDFFMRITDRIRQGQVPTATEVNEIAGERNFILTPVLINQQIDGFQNLFNRLFELLVHRGEVPPVPPELEGEQFRAVYTSPLVLGQREQQTDSALRTYIDLGVIAPIAPEILDNIDHDKIVRRILEQRGFPQVAIRTEEERDKIRDSRIQAQEQAQQTQEALETAKVLPGLGKPVDESSPLNKLTSALEGTPTQ